MRNNNNPTKPAISLMNELDEKPHSRINWKSARSAILYNYDWSRDTFNWSSHSGFGV